MTTTQRRTNTMGKPVFETLAAINCNEHTEIKKTEYTDKNGVKRTLELTYLSWAWAWWHIKKEFPDAFYTVYETPEGRPYFDDGRTAWVKTGVTIQGLEHIEYLPIMDHANRSIPADRLTSFDMNKAIQRSLTKACARHGLGLYLYAGEDLPDALGDEAREQVAAEVKKAPANKSATKVMTRQEFAERWSSDENGGGITWDDIAECAKAWGLCSKPKTMEMNKVRELVLQAAGLSPRLKFLQKADADTHAKWIKAIAEGATNKDGVTAEQAFKEKFSPTPEQWQAVLDEVFNYQLENDIH